MTKSFWVNMILSFFLCFIGAIVFRNFLSEHFLGILLLPTLLLAILITGFVRQGDKIEELEKQIKALEGEKRLPGACGEE